jgi:uncharacterized membrane protein (Fun14 family)
MVSPAPTSPAPPRSFFRWLLDMPTWKKVALAVAIGTLATGAALHANGSSEGVAGLSTSLLDGSTNDSANSANPAAKGVFRLGFSFLAGFCLGSFVRAALRVAAIAFGFWLAMTFVLSYYGLMRVEWDAISSIWDRFAANIENEWANFSTFVTGSLPAAGLAATGLVFGLKRH